MSDEQDSLAEPDDDPTLENVLWNLKRLEPPLETRIANRIAVAEALSALSAEQRHPRLSWWRRSFAIPVPVFAGLVVLIVLTVPLSIRGWPDRWQVHFAVRDQPIEATAGAPGAETAVANHTADAQAAVTHDETETYLCGIGRVNSESRYYFKE